MKWLDNWILRRAKRIRQREEILYEVSPSITSGLKSQDSGSIGSSRHRMSFTVYRANGGMMVEYNRYDERKDQHQCELHIVHPDQDLGTALGRIVTFESLKS
jgi:hypothetical protein